MTSSRAVNAKQMLPRSSFFQDPPEQIFQNDFPAATMEALPEGLVMPSRVAIERGISKGVIEIVAGQPGAGSVLKFQHYSVDQTHGRPL